jgi:hypothetical protein
MQFNHPPDAHDAILAGESGAAWDLLLSVCGASVRAPVTRYGPIIFATLGWSDRVIHDLLNAMNRLDARLQQECPTQAFTKDVMIACTNRYATAMDTHYQLAAGVGGHDSLRSPLETNGLKGAEDLEAQTQLLIPMLPFLQLLQGPGDNATRRSQPQQLRAPPDFAAPQEK